jgi:ketosteroid isomerase-like protein
VHSSSIPSPGRLNLSLFAALVTFAFAPFHSTLLAASDHTQLKREVAALEDAFCAMAQAKGLLAAFQHFAAPDVAFIDTDPRRFRGPDAVRERMGTDQPGVKLTWSASFTDVSADGTLGYNYGRYESRQTGPDGQELVRGGFFLTIWKRQPDGTWKYVMDTGAPDRPTPPTKP